MPKKIILLNNFTGGETDREIQERIDSSKRMTGLIDLENLIPSYAGPAEKRPGLRHASNAGGNVEATPLTGPKPVIMAPRLIPWSGSKTDQDLTIILYRGQWDADRNDYDTLFGVIQADGSWIWGAPTDGPAPDSYVTESSDTPPAERRRITPYGWNHGWPIGDTEHGVKYFQSEDVVTVTHPRYPPQEIRLHADGTWTLEPVQFRNGVTPVKGIRITGYESRNSNQGWNPTKNQEPLDIAVCVQNDDLGESLPGLAARDGRMLDPEHDMMVGLARSTAFVGVSANNELRTTLQEVDESREVARIASATTSIVTFVGFDKFLNEPGLFVRVLSLDGFKEGDILFFGAVAGTQGLRRRVFQVRRLVGVKGKTNDQRIPLFPPAGGVSNPDESSYDYDGPWLVIEPDPGPDAIRNILGKKVEAPGDIAGPDFVGEETLDGTEGETLPLYERSS